MATDATDLAPVWPELPAFTVPSAVAYSQWRLDEDLFSYAAIPLAQREGGLLLALPAAFRASAALVEAETAGFPGLLGPYLVTTAPLLGAANRPLATTAQVLVVDIDLAAAPVESIGPWSDELPDGATSVPFSTRGGRAYWLHPASVRAMAQEWLRIHAAPLGDGEEALPGAERATPYHTASEAAADDGEAEGLESGADAPGFEARGAASGPRAPPDGTLRQGRPLLVAASKTGRAAAPPPSGAAARAAAAAAQPEAYDDLDGAPISRAEVQELRRLLASQAAAGAGAALGAAAGAAPPRTAAPQLFDEASRIGLQAPAGVLDQVVGRGQPPPQRIADGVRETPATALVAAWPKAAAPSASSRPAFPRAPPGLPPPAVGAPAAEAAEVPEAPEAEGSASMVKMALQIALQAQNRQAQPQSHPLLGALSDQALDSSVAGGGSGALLQQNSMRGIARQQLWQSTLLNYGPEVRALMRSNLARPLGVEASELTPLAMFQYFRDHSPLGSHGDLHPLLTHMAWLSAELWRAAEEGRADRVHTLIACQCMFIDQTAGDQGRLDAAWFLTGLQNPPTRVTALHTAREANSPFSELVDPRWLSAQGEYMRELGTLRQQLAAPPPKGKADATAPRAETKPKGGPPPKGPKAKTKAGPSK